MKKKKITFRSLNEIVVHIKVNLSLELYILYFAKNVFCDFSHCLDKYSQFDV